MPTSTFMPPGAVTITAQPPAAPFAGPSLDHVPAIGIPLPAGVVASTATTQPADRPAAPATGTGDIVNGALVGALLAAAVVAAWNVWATRRRTREEERARQRECFAQAFKSYGMYKEFPYAIRRRRHDEPEQERVRLSEDLRLIQAELTYHQSWMDAEDPAVATAYRSLLKQTRIVAGGCMRQAWQDPAITSDRDMNISPDLVDLSSLVAYEKAYLDEVAKHLAALTPWWCR